MSRSRTSPRSSRRLFLRGAGGVALGLPFLASALSREAAAAPPPKRFVCFFTCNGVNMDAFWPSGGYGALNAAAFDGRAIEPLAGYADQLLLPRGIHMVPRGFGWDPSAGDDHAKGMGCKLTAQPLVEGSTYAAGPSVDQEIAKALNPPNTPALTLLVGGKSDGVLGHISYSGSEQPVTGENNPWLAYQDMVGVSNLDEDALARLTLRRESVLDLVRPEYESLLAKGLSKADRDKLDKHFTTVRDLELGMGNGLISCTLSPERAAELEALDPNTVSYAEEFKKVGRMQMDILALAIACGATHSATLQWGSGAGGPIFAWDGMSHQYNHHKLSHGNTKDDNSGSEVAGYEQMLLEIDRWYAGELAYLLDRLSDYEESDGESVLHHSLVLWANELSHGKDHDFRDLPFLIAGSAGGYLKSGEYIKVTAQSDTKNDADAPHNQLLTTCMNAVGVPASNFGGGLGEPGEMDALKA